ncbi:MAG: YdiU family protein [Thiomicrorhabdus sp.]|nr:YdiU family protein [Thiomicrorhabdus sp.]
MLINDKAMPKNKPTEFAQNFTSLPHEFYTLVMPEPMKQARLVHHNTNLAAELGLNITKETLFDMTTGQSFPQGLEPLAQKYTGHQFGYYNPDLGDGRGVLLGQLTDSHGQQWDLHLKGSGKTPYSRRGDGRAVLRSAVREYLIGEALDALGIPTTRCLSLCSSPEPVRREQIEPRATYIRVAKTHIRFGHFEWLAQKGDITQQKQLADYVIKTVYPELLSYVDSESRYGELLKTITRNTGSLIAGWQSVGFCHGVMNTDNMSVAGETFDFGPYAFLDDCQIHHICNHSDTEGRYAYSQQPNIGLWNCQVLAQAFSQLVSAHAIEEAIDIYINTFNQQYLLKMGYKFGLIEPTPDDKHFIADTLILLDKSGLDFHYFFHLLRFFNDENPAHQQMFKDFILESREWQLWQENYQKRIAKQSESARQERIAQSAPQTVLRNYIAQEIIDATENGNCQPLENWMQWLRTPYQPHDELFHPENHHYLTPPQNCHKGLALSCSS